MGSWGEERAFLEARWGGERRGPTGPPFPLRENHAPPAPSPVPGRPPVSLLSVSLFIFVQKQDLFRHFFFFKQTFQSLCLHSLSLQFRSLLQRFIKFLLCADPGLGR